MWVDHSFEYTVGGLYWVIIWTRRGPYRLPTYELQFIGAIYGITYKNIGMHFEKILIDYTQYCLKWYEESMYIIYGAYGVSAVCRGKIATVF